MRAPSSGVRVGPCILRSSRALAVAVVVLAIAAESARAAAGSATVDVIEYYNASQDHYFMSSLQADIDALDSGQLKGWARTGRFFEAYPQATTGASPVCRFYMPPAQGDSHFYSASPTECTQTRIKFPKFIEESSAVMYIELPDTTTGACPAGDVAVYRVWDNRVDSNHRYTTDPAVRAQMLAKGWVAEGYGPDQVIMCSPLRTPAALAYVAGSSVKLEQVIGDCDWQHYDWADQMGTCVPTTSQTVTRFDILGNGQGISFESNGKMIFLFGDTISRDPAIVNFHAGDPLAWSNTTDAEAGLLLDFYVNADGSPLFVKPPGIAMGGDDIPNAGISLPDGIYLVCNTGSDPSSPDPQLTDSSVLVRFDEAAKTFTAVRTISPPGGHFIGTSLHASGSNVFMFGAGPYRASDIYLTTTSSANFANGAGTQYFAGLVNGQPTWSNSSSAAVPVVQDNPLAGPPWPNDGPTVGNLSVAQSTDLGLWLMTYDGGRQSEKTRGVYFAYATQPWGPWSAPQLIYNDVRDKGFGVFIHNPNLAPPGDGLNGPTIGSNDPYTTPGGDFAPGIIERFTKVSGNTLSLYYTLSTWNPYTVVKMRSQFTITRAP